VRIIGWLLVAMPVLLLLLVGLLGMFAQAGIFCGAGFFGAIYVTLLFLGPLVLILVAVGLLLIFIPRR